MTWEAYDGNEELYGYDGQLRRSSGSSAPDLRRCD